MRETTFSCVPQPRAFQFKITINDIRPPIWRRFVVPWEFTLERLHDLLQPFFGWENSHLHRFTIDHKRYGTPTEDLLFDGDEREIMLRYFLTEGDTFEHVYEFGDDGHHNFLAEKLIRTGSFTDFPVFTGGARAGPPEDCRRSKSYNTLLNAFRARFGASTSCSQRAFDPDLFDITRTNSAILSS